MSINMDEIKVLIDEQTLQRRIQEMADQIKKDYEGKTITFICILKGSVFFTVDLAKKMSVQDFLRGNNIEVGQIFE